MQKTHKRGLPNISNLKFQISNLIVNARHIVRVCPRTQNSRTVIPAKVEDQPWMAEIRKFFAGYFSGFFAIA
jgi:hypothetical protein